MATRRGWFGASTPGVNGAATASQKGYRALKRTGPNQVEMLFK